ncbi:MAG: transporter, partial [Blastococcus sp.]|nr:transporter [Blastococcus sp.]
LRDKARDTAKRVSIDWWGNLTFGIGLIAILVAITYGLQPYGGHTMGWTAPSVLFGLIGGVILLIAFGFIELRVSDPMVDLKLFKIRAFAAGQTVNFLTSMARGGLQFMLIIWLQGIWLPLHGYSFESTPLWAAVYLLPLTVGFLLAGPLSGALSDRFGARWFATGGLLLTAVTYVGLFLIPVDFPYWLFALMIGLNGVGSGLFAAPNTAAIMSSVPASERGIASGMRGTFFNSGTSLSIGIFFSLMIVGLAKSLPQTLLTGLQGQGVSAAIAGQVAQLPPVASLFAAFLGYNPIERLLGPTGALDHVSADQAATLTGGQFFPQLISGPFHTGLIVVFSAAAAMSIIGALASLLRGGRYVHGEETA